MTHIDVMKQALEALDSFGRGESSGIPVTTLVTALRQAIIEAEQQGFAASLAHNALPRREWVELSETEQVQVAIDCGCADVAWLDFARAIEAKLKEKNA